MRNFDDSVSSCGVGMPRAGPPALIRPRTDLGPARQGHLQPRPAALHRGGRQHPSGAAGLHGWAVLLANPPGDLDPAVRHRLHELAKLETAWPELAHGDRIVHGDLRAHNMVRDHDRGVTFVDWAHTTTGPPCIDAVSLAPQLVLAGHTPPDIARLLDEHPATATDPLASTAFLATFTGHWHRNARRPGPPASAPTSTAQRQPASRSSATA